MKFKLGDFVRFVDERREGHITRIIDDKTVAVTDQDDFEIPVLASQVTWVHGKMDDTSESGGNDSLEQKHENFISKGIFLAVADDQRASAVVHFWLINKTDFQLLATLKTEKLQRFKGEFSGILQAKESVKIYSASLTEMDRWPEFHFQLLLYSKSDNPPEKPISRKEKFKAKDFSGVKKRIEELKTQGWLIQLDEPELVIDAQKLKESFHKPVDENPIVKKPLSEIDLHIEKLRDDHQFLNSNEKLDIQLEQFQKNLDAALVHKLGSIIFIHGVGNGTLRIEIHKMISKHPQVKTFMDARKEKFGYGATEIIFK
ncbi:Smr/MutS family protein [Daejeonella oryzae]|uniref:Smr/MutS family protein n=1 Tax=Daejeonella oryzae TaxID=1122943 RepID=UPI0003F5B776|nr:Smr/MutS family protein [Daejeonella oryzae]